MCDWVGFSLFFPSPLQVANVDDHAFGGTGRRSIEAFADLFTFGERARREDHGAAQTMQLDRSLQAQTLVKKSNNEVRGGGRKYNIHTKTKTPLAPVTIAVCPTRGNSEVDLRKCASFAKIKKKQPKSCLSIASNPVQRQLVVNGRPKEGKVRKG